MTHDPWIFCSVVHSMGHGWYNVVQSIMHGKHIPKICCTILYDPWVMEFCHIVWPMGHGEFVGQKRCCTTHDPWGNHPPYSVVQLMTHE